eukprot:13743224-Ditylum_brightwellii.AAC.2
MGVHTMHPSSAPGYWVESGGMPEMGYISGTKGMMENKDVMKEKELKKFKCSLPTEEEEERMNFGEELKYDQSGGNARTCRKPFLPCGEISFDKNGMPQYHAKHNHPRAMVSIRELHREEIHMKNM